MTPLRDAAESATAGVPVVFIQREVLGELAKHKDATGTVSSGLLRQPFGDPVPLVPLSELDTARAEIDRLGQELEHFTKSGIIEVAVRNPSVMDYMRHWEGRAETAEAALTAEQARIADLEGALSKIDHEYETEYAGRSYTRCTSCNVATSEDEPHHADCAWATLSPVKENDRG